MFPVCEHLVFLHQTLTNIPVVPTSLLECDNKYYTITKKNAPVVPTSDSWCPSRIQQKTIHHTHTHTHTHTHIHTYIHT